MLFSIISLKNVLECSLSWKWGFIWLQSLLLEFGNKEACFKCDPSHLLFRGIPSLGKLLITITILRKGLTTHILLNCQLNLEFPTLKIDFETPGDVKSCCKVQTSSLTLIYIYFNMKKLIKSILPLCRAS